MSALSFFFLRRLNVFFIRDMTILPITIRLVIPAKAGIQRFFLNSLDSPVSSTGQACKPGMTALVLCFALLHNVNHISTYYSVHRRCLCPLRRLKLAESLHQLADQARGFCVVHFDHALLKSQGHNGLLVLRRDDLDPLLGELLLVTGKEHRLEPYGTACGREFVRLTLRNTVSLSTEFGRSRVTEPSAA